MTKEFIGKNVIVTGGSSGIGAATAEAFARKGANVLITYNNNKEAADEVVAKLLKYGIKAAAIVTNMGNMADVKNLFQEALNFFDGHIDILVNNAAIILRKHCLNVDEKEYDDIMNTNVKGPLFLAKYVINQMLAKKIEGTVINVSSINSYMVGEKIGDYGATKAALDYYTKVLAYELAKSRIRINSLDLGLVPTNMNAIQSRSQPSLWKSRVDSIPLKEATTPEQAAAGILYLASNKKSGNTTGVSLAIAGGSNIPIEDRFLATTDDLQSNIDERQVAQVIRAKL